MKPWPFFPGPSQLGGGLSAGSHTPRLPRFAHSLVPLPHRLCASSVSDRRAARWNRQVPRVPLPNGGITPTGETCTPSPARTLLLRLGSYGLMRRSRAALPYFSIRLVGGVFAGCYQPLLPPGSSRRYLCESFLGCLVPYHGRPTECLYLFLPPRHRLPQQGYGSACPLLSANTIFHGAYFRGCRHSLMFKPPSLLTLPDRSYPCAIPPQGS